MPAKRTVLTVDNNHTNLDLLAQELQREGYEAMPAASLEELDAAILGGRPISLGLIDLSGFDQRIWERCERLRQARIPFIVVAPQRSPTVQRASLKVGAGALLVKPIGIRDLMEFIRTELGD